MTYEPVIGLEIHAQLKTKTKMFCGSLNDPDETHPNVHVCPVCMGHPGTLPVPNKKAIESVVKVGLALSCEIAKRSKFDRKNYFYPDLPKGYQISQYDMPLCERGTLDVLGKKVRITRIHLEEDTGRLVHNKLGSSFVDFNRAGVPLMELVTEPDIRNAEEAVAFAKKLQTILQYLDVSEANLEKGQMRCEVNISMRKPEGEFGTKVEIKNINSFSAVRDAIAYEIKRQSAALAKGEKIVQETRGWDENKKATVSQRLKESAHDYRYFPEPDLSELVLGGEEGAPEETVIDVEKIRASLPELPDQKKARFQKEFSLSEKETEVLASDKYTASFFEHVVSELDAEREIDKALVKLAVNYLNTDLRKLINETGTPISEMLVSAENFAELVGLLHEGKITSSAGKMVLEEMFRTGKDPSNIIEEKGLAQVSDIAELEKTVLEIIAAHPKVVTDYKAGKQNALQFLLGQLMAKTKGKANPETSAEILKKLLS
ncbi:glutaminyl-tRNA synthase (glutamine-hydrolyzing) subunit B [Candidatus Azambacteria bacterium RIFCSPHIGHO2_02_FULL_52_12]|uniref:Aspartyl/glutamyl-tRNA(Asn/Gln) amidotransferase subunit B n=1 Tax=Candidatus Azambacteria bacterium RIFCSPLOWO2_01_FULL_46_25 TaxID=1797298 RepID=A0A1F5BVD7_9BACT|nr:MAG: glutaminyl-tRNA synthase (glutamine-hydrolyzing) subunit B [Candidatus Azambacteria bacterium RIFCSPHIGHO2_02_FULL_52_12]OGD34575.1 MAG: glutaminyl-tRNA synthase (glutamine-hydrolyzing) subunit B [Candidatus Azambacteria bacterium RIFCSPLOWO2_01_FULL_46_25]OGD37981.1 MAG: glutaminyl-tRNA synthase (glutamine-hydrolyzing) subunit B [Candidatus Azambacteria bacterium RIFCSPHIGHO2_01_FULL_51_74]